MREQSSVVLTNAKAAIVEHGWIQRKLGDTDRGMCAIGAVAHVTAEFTIARKDSLMYLEKALPEKYTEIGYFNDVPWRLKKRVLQLFSDAIALAVADEQWKTRVVVTLPPSRTALEKVA